MSLSDFFFTFSRIAIRRVVVKNVGRLRMCYITALNFTCIRKEYNSVQYDRVMPVRYMDQGNLACIHVM